MRKNKLLSLWSMLLLLTGPVPVSFAEQVTIGSKGSTTMQNAPVNYFYTYSRAQMIYDAEEINIPAGSIIKAVSFDYKSAEKNITGNLNIDLGETENTFFAQTSYVSGLYNCYSGHHNMDFTGTNIDKVVTYNFDNDYTYEGGNLVVDIHNTGMKRNGYVRTPFYCESTTEKKVVAYGNDGNITGNPSLFNDRPIITILYEKGSVPEEPVLSITQTTIDFGFVKEGNTYTQHLSFKNKGKADLTLSEVEGLSDPFSAELPHSPIAYGETGSIKIFYNPTSVGIANQQITIKSNGGEQVINLKGESFSENSYYEYFDVLATKPVPSGWYSSNNNYNSYSSNSTGGIDNSRYLSCSTPEDTLYSPPLMGRGFFYVKGKSTSSQLSLYLITTDGSRIPLKENVVLTDSWKEIPFDIEQSGTRIAFSMNDVYLDNFFASKAFLPARDIEIFSHATDRPSSFMSINDEEPTPVIFRIRNMGTQPIAPGSYHIKTSFHQDIPYNLTMFGEQADGNVITNTPGLGLDETAILEASMIISLSEKERISGLTFSLEILNDDETANNKNTCATSLSIIPKIGKLVIPVGGQKEKTLDFGTFKTENKLTAVLQNEGIDALTISNYHFLQSGNFTLEGEKPLSIPAKGKANIEIKLSGTPGIYEDSLIITHNGSSDSHSKLYLKGTILSDISLLESFEENEFPPIFWRQTGNSWYRYTANKSNIYDGLACLAKNNNTADTIITPQLMIKKGDKFSFHAKSTSGSGKIKVLYSSNKRNWKLLEEFSVYSAYTNREVAFPENILGEYYIGLCGENIYLDFICGPEVIYADHRLEIENFDGKKTGMVNMEQNFELTIRNTGINDEAASDYNLTLQSGNEVIGKFDSEDIAFAERKIFSTKWTPNTTGRHDIFVCLKLYEEIIYSDTLTINVEEEQSLQNTAVGNYALPTTNAPWMTNYKHSGAEIIYKANELNLASGSKISRLSLPYVADDTISFNAQVWIANTTDDNFPEARKLTITGKNKVYEKLVQFEKSNISKHGILEIDFNEPFVYNGENLNIVISFDASRYRAIKFFKNETQANQVLFCRVDGSENAPGIFETLSGTAGKYFPTMIFTCLNDPAMISGKVTDGNTPVGEAAVSLNSDHIRYSSVTETNGVFSIPVHQLSRKYCLKIEKEGFETYTDSIEIGKSSIVIPEITLKSVIETPPFTMSLSVSAITNENLENVPVYLENNELGLIYNYTLNTDGKCYISDIYPGSHTLIIEKEGLAKFEDKNLEISKSMSFDIVLQENVRTPFAIKSDILYNPRTGDSELKLSWNRETDYFFDDFESHTPFTINLNPWIGIDGDNANAAQLQGSYPNRGLKQYATIFNPLEIVPSVWYTYPVLRPYSGKQYASFIRTESGVRNNDWLISPKIKVGVNNIVNFKAKAGDRYKERFCVSISTTGTNESDFKMLNPGNYLEVGYDEWKDISFDLSEYEGKEVHIAIQYTSAACFMLMVDDFYLGPREMNRKLAKRNTPHSENKNSERFQIYCDGEQIATTTDHSYTFNNLSPGTHTLGVKATYLVSESEMAYIDVKIDEASEFANLTLEVKANGGSTENIPVEFVNLETGEQHIEPIVKGIASLPYLHKGKYLVNIQDDRYTVYSENIILDDNKNVKIELTELLNPVKNLTADYEASEESGKLRIHMNWNQDLGWSDGFETYENFTQKIGDWISIDQDKMPGYGIEFAGSDVSFPGVGQAMACLVFNAGATTPSMIEDGAIRAAEGEKSILFISPQVSQANDWLITPSQHIREGYVMRFMAKSYTDFYAETFRVCVSSDTDPENFTIIDEITPGQDWTTYEIDLSAYVNQKIHLAFNYVSYDKFMCLVDEVYVGPVENSGTISSAAKSYKVYLDGKEMGSTETNSFTIDHVPFKEEITVGVKAVYDSGESEITEYKIHPVPTSIEESDPDKLFCISTVNKTVYLTTPEGSYILVFNQTGQKILENKTETTHSSFDLETSGIYFIKVVCKNREHTFKVMIP
ncbi:MAG: choice-of-anchor J domain-containing protein [Bacteroidales bacterium]